MPEALSDTLVWPQSGLPLEIRAESGQTDAFFPNKISPRKAALMEADDQRANFRSAAVPFYGSRMLHGGESAAVTHSGLDADGWANTFVPLAPFHRARSASVGVVNWSMGFQSAYI